MADDRTDVTDEGDEDDQLPKGDWDADAPTPDQIGDSARDLGIDDPSMPPKRESKEGEPAPSETPPEGGDEPKPETPKIKIGEKEYDQTFLEETLSKAENLDKDYTEKSQANAERQRRLDTEVNQATLIRKDLEERLKSATPKPEEAGPGRHEKSSSERGFEEGSPEMAMAKSLDKSERENTTMRTDILELRKGQQTDRDEAQNDRDVVNFDGQLSTLHSNMRLAEKVDTPAEVKDVMRYLIINHRDTTLKNTPEMFAKVQDFMQTVYNLGRNNAVLKVRDAPRGRGPQGSQIVTRKPVDTKGKSDQDKEDDDWSPGSLARDTKDYLDRTQEG